MTETKVFAISGFSNSGKTTVISMLINKMKQRGHSIITIKHTHQDILPPDGTDTRTHWDAGADGTILVGPQIMTIIRQPLTIREISQQFKADFILVEGMKHIQIPRFWCVGEDGAIPREIKSIIACVAVKDEHIKQKVTGNYEIFDITDIDTLVGLIESNAIPVNMIDG